MHLSLTGVKPHVGDPAGSVMSVFSIRCYLPVNRLAYDVFIGLCEKVKCQELHCKHFTVSLHLLFTKHVTNDG